MKVLETLQLLLDSFPVHIVTATIIFPVVKNTTDPTKMLWQTLWLLLLQLKIKKIYFT